MASAVARLPAARGTASADAQSDLWSVGAVLYELLTGHRAQVADTSSPVALDRSIVETDPPPPSVRAAAAGDRALAYRLRGDLDTIVMTAIRKEPERRYGSAAALSDDLGRFLDGHPVAARPNTARYRAGKFLRRHWTGVAVGTLLVASIVAGAASTLYQARRAERRFAQVRTLANAFVFDVHDRVATLPGSTAARKAIVQIALNYLENLREEASGDAGLARELAAAYHKIGRVQGELTSANLGDTAGAVASFTRAESLLTPLADRGDRLASKQLVSVVTSLAKIQEGQGHRDVAMRTFARAQTIGEQLILSEPDDLELLASVSASYTATSRAAINITDYAHAERAARRAMELARTVAQRDPANRKHRDTLSDAYSVLSSALRSTGRLSEAADSVRQSIAVREQLVREEPDNTDYRRQLLIGYGHLGDLLGFRSGENLGDLDGAAAAFARAATIADGMRQQDPLDRRAWSDLANARYRLGYVLADDPRHASEGLAQLEDAERWAARLVAPDPSVYQHAYLAIGIERAIASALVSLGRFDEAARRLEHVRAVAPRFMDGRSGPDARGQFLWATLRLARLRARTNDARAAALADRAGLDLEAIGTLPTPFATAKAWGDLGRLYVEIARHDPTNRRRWLDKATPLLEKSVTLWHGVKLAPGAEGQSRKELDGVEADLAASRMPRTASR